MPPFCTQCGRGDFDEKGNCLYCSGSGIKWLTSGTLLDGRYEITGAIKAGGMGAIYRAFDRRLQQVCALKEMLSEEDSDFEYLKKRFLYEAKLLADLRHNGIPRVTDYFTQNNRYYLVMDYLEGRDLFSYIDEERQATGIEEEQAVKWAKEICSILIYLHGQKPHPVLHRDLKPSNIFLCNDKRLMLIDFGLARTVNPDSCTEKSLVGTLGYAPMEQYQGHPEPRSDIYSLGAVMHFLLTAIQPAPFKFEPLRSVRPDVSEWLENIIKKALSIKPENRFSSALEFKEVLEKKKEAGEYKDDSGDLEKIQEELSADGKGHLLQKGFLLHRRDIKDRGQSTILFDVSKEADVEAAMDLAEKGDERVTDVLIKMFSSKDFEDRHRKIVHLLGNYKSEEVVETLVKALASPDETIRRYAPMSLAKGGSKNALKDLTGLLIDSSVPVRKSALKAIGQLSGNPHMYFLELYLTEDKKNYIDKFPGDVTLYFETLEELVFNLAKNTNPLQCYVHLAILYEVDGKYSEAEENIKKALEIKKEDINILNIYLRILMGLKNYQEAEKNIKKIYKLKKADTNLKLTHAQILLELKKYAGAIEIYDEVYLEKQQDEIEDKLREAYYYYGRDLEKAGRPEEAIEQYEKACLLNPAYKEKEFFDALVHFKNKKYKKSLKSLKSYIAGNPEGNWYEKALKLKEEIETSPFPGLVSWVKGLWE